MVVVGLGWEEEQGDVYFPSRGCVVDRGRGGGVVHGNGQAGAEEGGVEEGVAGVPFEVWAGCDLRMG
jgi:hypothetical protein